MQIFYIGPKYWDSIRIDFQESSMCRFVSAGFLHCSSPHSECYFTQTISRRIYVIVWLCETTVHMAYNNSAYYK